MVVVITAQMTAIVVLILYGGDSKDGTGGSDGGVDGNGSGGGDVG